MNAPANLSADAARATMIDVLDRQKAAHIREGATSAELRIDRINRCIKLLIDYQDRIVAALDEDFGARSKDASALTDIAGSIGTLKHAREKVKTWMRPEKHKTTPAILGLLGAKAAVEHMPKGTVGVISHVEAMQEQIPAQLTVRTLPDGHSVIDAPQSGRG